MGILSGIYSYMYQLIDLTLVCASKLDLLTNHEKLSIVLQIFKILKISAKIIKKK